MSKHKVIKRLGEDPAFPPDFRPWKALNCGTFNMGLRFESWADAMDVALMSDADQDDMIGKDFESDGGW